MKIIETVENVFDYNENQIEEKIFLKLVISGCLGSRKTLMLLKVAQTNSVFITSCSYYFIK